MTTNRQSLNASQDEAPQPLPNLSRRPQRYRLSFSHVNRASRKQSATGSSESGTEADDETESKSFAKALPAPNLRPRKGLKIGEDEDALLTPNQLDDDGRIIEVEGYFKPESPTSDAEDDNVLFKRRLHEFARRCSEVGLVAVMFLIVLYGRGVWQVAIQWKYELLAHLLIMIGLVAAYPVKLSLIDTRTTFTKPWQRFRVPASFDPATVLYPPLLPVMVALSVSPINSSIVLPNIVLGLSSLPQRLFPRSFRVSGFNTVHWLIAILPLAINTGVKWLMSISSTADLALSQETLICLYPLHQALIVPLHWLTINSLLISEVHLLSAALINLLLFARAPQAVILKACLWIGGVSLFVYLEKVLHWNVTLARVPRWKLRRPGHQEDDRRSLIDSVADVINLQRATKVMQTQKAIDSDADEDYDPTQPLKPSRPTKSAIGRVLKDESTSVVSDDSSIRRLSRPNTPNKRRNTLPEPGKFASMFQSADDKQSKHRSHLPWFLHLSPAQLDRRKIAYATWTYAVIVIVILLPIRIYVSKKALFNAEAIGWALGYLLGQLPFFRHLVYALSIDFWIPLPPAADMYWPALLEASLPLDVAAMRVNIGPANVHLLLILYIVTVLAFGLIAVFTLTPYVEVDTRRKIFHGVMVAMFLPATFIDPCYCALALSLVLTVFLLLEVIRAGQVPPLGTAIGRFIAPYVDGRDLRGPVVVSHLFLAIGCAMPLWFSLAALRRQDDTLIWHDWETNDQARDVGMLAGVICVGMGDAAASLIGRRYGRRKWPWVGGKSLEGSAAFAVAVTIGLLAAKIWLWLGGWHDVEAIQHGVLGWMFWLVRAAVSACGASFLEACLTGANDNVVCPIALWLLVKGLQL